MYWSDFYKKCTKYCEDRHNDIVKFSVMIYWRNLNLKYNYGSYQYQIYSPYIWKVFVNHKICKHTMFIAYTIIFMMTWNVKCLSIRIIMGYFKNQSCFVYQLRFLVIQYTIQDSIKNCQYLWKLYKNFVTNCYNYSVDLY